MNALKQWLATKGCQGMGNLQIAETVSEDGDVAGYGCFALKDFAVGDILFTVPQQCIFSYWNAMKFPLAEKMQEYATGSGAAEMVTAELLIWLEMSRQRQDPHSPFHVYLKSLNIEEPTISSWHPELREALEGTNLASMISSSAADRLRQQLALFQGFLATYAEENKNETTFDSDMCTTLAKIDLASLCWARGHYLSRRYPDEYVRATPSSTAETHKRSCKREDNFGNMGALVPLLDILNHRPGVAWLSFNATEEALEVICNHPVKKGAELFSNYGALSNEILLYTYGFASDDNVDDAVAVRMSVRASVSKGTSNTYYIKSDGLSGVPQDLWQQLSALGADPEPEQPASLKRKREDENKEAVSDLAEVRHCSDKDDSDEGSPVEVGVEEIEMLYEYLHKKFDILQASEFKAHGILENYARRHPADKTAACRCRFINLYRAGQALIMSDLLLTLEEILEGGEEEEEESDEEE